MDIIAYLSIDQRPEWLARDHRYAINSRQSHQQFHIPYYGELLQDHEPERGRDRSNEPLHFIASVYRVHSNDQPKIFQVIKSIIFPGLIRNRSEQSLSFVLFIDRHQPLPLFLILRLSAIQVHNPNPILFLNHRWQAESLIIIAS